MGGIIERVDAWIAALVFAGAMLAAWGIGWREGRRLPSEPREDPGIKFTDASLAILGLLLAFTFSLSLSRHDQRRAMVVADSNAIGDFYTCASLIGQPTRSNLQAVIREYTQRKVDLVHDQASTAELEKSLPQFEAMQGRMTELVAEAVGGQGTPIAVSLTNTLNEVTSSHAARLAAYRERLPWSIVVLLFLGSAVPAFLVGLKQGSSPRPHLSATLCFILLVTLVIYVTLDLNQPRRGLITVSQEPLERLVATMGK